MTTQKSSSHTENHLKPKMLDKSQRGTTKYRRIQYQKKGNNGIRKQVLKVIKENR